MAKLRTRENEDVVLNLIPIMNLFTALIPFLLLSAAFFHLSIVTVVVPTVSEAARPEASPGDAKVTLNLRILPSSFEAWPSSETANPAVLHRLRATLPRGRVAPGAEDPALVRLTETAFQVKSRFPASDTVIVMPNPEVSYEDVVAALDAVRESITTRGSTQMRVLLFPRAVMTGSGGSVP